MLTVPLALAKDGKYDVRVYTRTASSTNAQLLSQLPNVTITLGSSTSEPDLRQALKGITHAFVNLNSFAIGQKAETYWGIRIFELCVESGVKHFTWSALDYTLRNSGYDESMRCGHYEGKARVTEWMKSQPLSPMMWSVLTTGPYMEALSESHRPLKDADGTYVFRAPLNDGAMPYIHLNDLGRYAKWIFDTPEAAAGFDLKIATEHVNYTQIAEAFTAITGKPARYENISLDAWFDDFRLPAEHKFGAEYEGPNDDTLMTVRENFSAWWRMYQASAGNKGVVVRDYELLDRILPDRVRSVGEWMRKTGYDAEEKPLLDNGSGRKALTT